LKFKFSILRFKFARALAANSGLDGHCVEKLGPFQEQQHLRYYSKIDPMKN